MYSQEEFKADVEAFELGNKGKTSILLPDLPSEYTFIRLYSQVHMSPLKATATVNDLKARVNKVIEECLMPEVDIPPDPAFSCSLYSPVECDTHAKYKLIKHTNDTMDLDEIFSKTSNYTDILAIIHDLDDDTDIPTIRIYKRNLF